MAQVPSTAKSILNATPAPPDEIKDMIHSIQNDSAAKSLSRIMKVYTQSHLFLNQWKALQVDTESLKRIIGMVRRFETSGLQLDGKGLWLLTMLLENSCENLTIDDSTCSVLFDTLLRIAVETTAYAICTSTLYLLTTKFDASCGKLFQTGCAIADHLPDSIPADNFISLMNFALVCMQQDRTCALLACKFLVYLAANVTPNHKVNYFLPGVVSRFATIFLEDSAEEQANSELKREIEVYILVLLTYLAPLHPTHAHIIMTHKAHLPATVVRRLDEGTFSEAGESAALLFLDSLCIDTNAKDTLRSMISVKLMRSKMNVFSPTVTEKATKLFLSLYANDIECNYRSRSSVDLRESRSTGNLGRLSEDAFAGGSPKSARSDRSYSLNGVTCLRDLLGIVLTITEAALQAQAQEVKDDAAADLENRDESGNTAGGASRAESTHISTSAAFHYMNSIVYQVGLYVQIHRIYSLHDVVARIVALILSQFDRMDEFDLKNAKIIDTLFILVGMRERCWQPFAADIIDTDFMEMSPALLEHFVTIADPVVTDSTSEFNMPCSPEPRDFMNTNLLNSKVINFAKDKFAQSSDYLENFLEEWEVESIEGISRRLLLIYCKVQLGGLESVAGLLDLELFQELLWDVMTDERHGLDAYPEMKRKCIQLFTTVGMHLNSTSLPAGASSGSNTPTQAAANAAGSSAGQPKQLTNAVPLAEYVIKILCSHEHASASDEDDELALNNMHLNPGLSSQIGTHNNPPASGVSDLGGLNGKSEGGKCVSRIFRTHKHNVQLRYTCLSCIMYICEHNRSVRRKVIASYAEIASNFSYLDAVRSMPPLLHLVALASEYLTKVESAGEESIVTLIVRALSYPDAVVRTLACDVISVIGASSPGLMHRGICRPEVEHLLLEILQTACAEEEPQQHTGPLVRSVLKACNALTHDINVRPCWVPSPYTYHWTKYSMDLATRPLFVVSFLDTLQLVVRRASRTYIIQYFAVVLSIVTCLMYSCNDGVFGPAIPKSSPTHVADLKAALIEKFLPWMPIALDYLTSFKKIIRSMMAVPLHNHENGGSSHNSSHNSPNNRGSPNGNPAGSVAGTAGTAGAGAEAVSAPVPTERLPEQVVQDKEAAAKDTNKSSTQKAGLNIMNRIKRKSNANVVIVESVVLPDKKQDVKYSPGAEYLAEKLIESLHAFLCMDEMFPLSTYLQNATLFNGTPVIACVSYFMTECKSNLKVQRRGIDFVKHFADNQIGLSSIAMHSPSAIMHAARSLSDTLEVQYSFCKIVSAVARSDDFARENFIRFNVQSLLVELVLRQHPEQSKLACLALTDLCVHDTDTIAVCQSAGVVDAVLALLDSMPNDFKIQTEGVRVLVTVDQVPELLMATRKVSVSQILKRTKKFLTAAVKQEQLPDNYEKSDIEALLASPIWAKDPLLSKILGFFS